MLALCSSREKPLPPPPPPTPSGTAAPYVDLSQMEALVNMTCSRRHSLLLGSPYTKHCRIPPKLWQTLTCSKHVCDCLMTAGSHTCSHLLHQIATRLSRTALSFGGWVAGACRGGHVQLQSNHVVTQGADKCLSCQCVLVLRTKSGHACWVPSTSWQTCRYYRYCCHTQP